MSEQFKWINFYTEFATKLLEYKDDRTSLIEKIQKVYSNIGMKLPKLESNNVPKDIDPFTVFGLFNKGITDSNRISIIGGIKDEFGVSAEVPENFSGIPVLTTLMSTFYAFEDNDKRNDEDIDNLWNVFEAAIEYSISKSDITRKVFGQAYNQVKSQYAVKWNLTMGLYWIRPNSFINLDSRNREFLSDSNNISADVATYIQNLKALPDADEYLSICDKCHEAVKSGMYGYSTFPELSHKAWIVSSEKDKVTINQEDFWPSAEEYQVNLSKDDWKRFIEEVEINHRGCMRVLKCYLDIGGVASPKKMSDIYKGHSMVYTSSVSNTSRRALKYFEMKPCPDVKKPGTEWLFPIAFQGRNSVGEESGTYVYKMRSELMEALKEIDLSDIELEYKKESDEMSIERLDKNIILYGPPGTGKTYNSAIYAVSICDDIPVESLNDYNAVMARYKELKTEGRIAFTTFHQSYGYEEFIEGIKPVIGDDSGEVGYRIESGVFKRFCNKARKKTVTANIDIPDVSGAKVWCVLLDGTGESELKKQCFSENTIRIGWKDYPSEIDSETEGLTVKARRILLNFQDEMEIGDIVVVQKSNKTIDGIAVVTGDYEYVKNDRWPRVRRVKWLMTGEEIDITELNGGKNLGRKSVYPLNRVSADSVLSLVNTSEDVTIEEEERPYVFIIDEINRGNISKIFGELITLIEDTKREGMLEAASAKLPYSGEYFSVPSNVYIIGTMNTADRSIALMDTALRRRFQFKEMMPDVNVLRKLNADKVGELDIAEMLEKINERITFLYDREHTIGHAFFTGLKEEPTIDRLASIFKKSVIPLLQEYFYEDYQKIQMVLGDNGKTSDNYKFIKDTTVKATEIFKGSVEDVIDLPEKKYEINEDAFSEIQSYIEII